MTTSDAMDTTGGHAPNGGMFKLKHLIDSFHANIRVLVKAGINEPTTLRWYQDQLAHLDGLAELPADTLRTHHLVEIELTNAFARALKRLYRWAAGEDLVPRDPFAKLAIPPCGARTRVLTRPELRRLYLASNGSFRRLLFVQLRTIARPGEIRQLTWGQVNWDHRVIVLGKFKGQKRRREKVKARPIPLSLPVVRLLKNMHRKSADPSATGRVFYNERWYQRLRNDPVGGRGAGPWTANGVRCAMRVARRKAGLEAGGERVCCYTLRHTSATNAIRADVPLKVVAEMMGHARSSTTERYVHLDTADLLAGIDRVSAKAGRAAG